MFSLVHLETVWKWSQKDNIYRCESFFGPENGKPGQDESEVALRCLSQRYRTFHLADISHFLGEINVPVEKCVILLIYFSLAVHMSQTEDRS